MRCLERDWERLGNEIDETQQIRDRFPTPDPTYLREKGEAIVG